MKTVFQSHNAVAHAWAHQSQSEGRASRVFFDGAVIYSYGRHFPVARFAKPDVVLFTMDRYSVSTSKHMSIIRRAIPPGIKVIPAPFVGFGSERRNRDGYQALIDKAVADAAAPRIREATRAHHLAKAAGLAETANEYAAAMGEEWRIELPAGTIEEAREWQAKANEREAEKIRIANAKAAEGIARWKAREQSTAPHTSAAYLRLSSDGQAVETSWGANVPTDHARRAWPVLRPVILGESPEYHRNGRTLHLGEYAIESASAQMLVVGCHRIPAKEVLEIAGALGLDK